MLEKMAETPEFTGHVISALYEAPNLLDLSGSTLIGAEQAIEYGITDRDGKSPPSHRHWLGAPRVPNQSVIR